MMIHSDWFTVWQPGFLLKPLAAVTSNESLPITHLAEAFLREFALFLKIILEFAAIMIIAVSLVKTVHRYLQSKQQRYHQTQQALRLELGLTLALSLELLLAADIVGTAVSPTWDAIGRLGAITGIRTFLNFFLQKEVQELQKMDQRIWQQRELKIQDDQSTE